MIQTTDRITGALSLSPMTIKELSRRLSMNRFTVYAAVRRLVDAGKVYCWNVMQEGQRKARKDRGRPQRAFGLRWKP